MSARALAWLIDPMGDDLEGFPPKEVIFQLNADWSCEGVAVWSVPRRAVMQGVRLRRLGSSSDDFFWFEGMTLRPGEQRVVMTIHDIKPRTASTTPPTTRCHEHA